MKHLSRTVAILLLTASRLTAANNWTLIGWSDFGVNPLERDYSLFAIYPPYGTLHAQLIDSTGALYTGTTPVTLTYKAIADPSGSINSTSSGKTNYFQFAQPLFGDLAQSDMPGSGNAPQSMTFEASYQRFTATGIPITPYDDSLNLNYYPLIQLTACDAAGNVLATTRVTLPVSNEVECRGCHASATNPAARPVAGYFYDSNPNRDFKLNILRLHDEKNRDNPDFQAALATLHYSSSGILATAVNGTPVSCTACHGSNLFGNPGISGIESLTSAMHSHHSAVIDPATNAALDKGADRAACYHCHPGTHTQALRGAMARSVSGRGSLQIQCQNCHGTMSALGRPSRNGWMDLPNCQACHVGTATTEGGAIRLTNALDPTGALNRTTDATFATNAPLFRNSTGHGNLQCAACHGSTHAELHSTQANDNLQAINLTGNAGPLQDCTTCHQGGISSSNGGPHGMHEIGASWVTSHQKVAAASSSSCQACHGKNSQGTVLSRTSGSRTLTISPGTIQMFPGYQVGCDSCHNLAMPVVTDAGASVTSGQSATIPITVTNGGVLRIVSQPLGGTAYVSGNTIIYQAPSNFEGTDQITYAALNNLGSSGGRDSNLGTATIEVTSPTRPLIVSQGVTNAASYAPGIAPGMIAHVFGSGMGPADLASYELNSGGFVEKASAGTQVFFNGIPAPLLYTSDSQLSAILPYDVSGSAASMVVEYNGIQSAPVAIPLAAVLPGVFTADGSGKGPAAAINQDGSVNSVFSPAPRGSMVTLFVTGEGATNPPLVDGRLAAPPFAVPAQPVTVTIGGQIAQVQYAGGAPGEVAGIMRLNVFVPIGLPPGTATVLVSVGGTPSAGGVTMEVR